MNSSSPTAAILLIGNEILSGRTADKNLNWIAKELTAIGVRLQEARVIHDIEQTIIATVNEMRNNFTYVFTTGGIGPTHDDITAAAIAKAFNTPIERHPEAVKLLENHYEEGQLNEARLKMAEIPVGASLIPNPVSAAPGFIIENVHVMAGVPRIMQAMFDAIRPTLTGGKVINSQSISVMIPEGNMAEGLSIIQKEHPTVEIGCYPLIKNGGLGSTIVLRTDDATAMTAAVTTTHALMKSLDGEPFDNDTA